MLDRAITLALIWHKDKTDRGGHPYILHLMHVANKMDTEEEKTVAILHDILEDTGLTEEELRALFPEEIVEAVVTLTRGFGNEYKPYIFRVAKNPLACQVKIEDIKHNMDLSRIPHPKKLDFERIKKYKIALMILER